MAAFLVLLPEAACSNASRLADAACVAVSAFRAVASRTARPPSAQHVRTPTDLTGPQHKAHPELRHPGFFPPATVQVQPGSCSPPPPSQPQPPRTPPLRDAAEITAPSSRAPQGRSGTAPGAPHRGAPSPVPAPVLGLTTPPQGAAACTSPSPLQGPAQPPQRPPPCTTANGAGPPRVRSGTPAAGILLCEHRTVDGGRTLLGRPASAARRQRCSSSLPAAWAGVYGSAVQTRTHYAMTASLRADIQAAALKKQTGVSLKYLLDFGMQPLERQMLLSARFLHAEIPIRLAHRLMDLNHLPRRLSEEPHVRRVKGWYAESFADFRAFPAIKDSMDVVRFTAMLKNAFRRHNNVVPAIAKGVEEYKSELERTHESSRERESEIQHFLDTFFLSRIAIRFLAGHHIAMFEPPRPDHIGLVNTRCCPFTVASDAVSEARAMCFREYGGAPQVTMLGNTGLTMAYVPSHLHHMVFELVKNSLRAVQERFSESDTEPPPIQVVVAEGLEDVTIKVSDQGGGIARSGLPRIWTYLYTTARSPLPDVDIDSTNMPTVLAGYGCGLPLSRLYARYFGGDLQIISMEGYGTDAYLHLARLGNDEEPLPGAV